MLSYTHFTHDERISLHNFLKDGLGIREIARRLGRNPSTISREIKRNSSSKGYHHWRAQVLTICRRRHQRRTALKAGTPQYDYTLEKLLKLRQSVNVHQNKRARCPAESSECRKQVFIYMVHLADRREYRVGGFYMCARCRLAAAYRRCGGFDFGVYVRHYTS